MFGGHCKELTYLTHLLTQCQQEQGFAAILGGPTGIGKTHLLEEFAEHAAREGAIVLSATASQDEQNIEFGVLGQLLQSAPAGSGARLMAELVLADETRLVPGTGYFVQRVYTMLHSLSQQAPLILVVDDVEFIDTASLHCLRAVIRRSRTARIGVVLARSISASHDRLAEIVRLPRCHRIWLSQLTLPEVVDFLSGHMDALMADGLAPVFHAISGGSPLLLAGLLEDHSTAGPTEPTAARVTVGAGYRAALQRCLSSGPAMMREVVNALAVLGDTAPLDLVVELIDEEQGLVEHMVSYLGKAGVLRDGRFRHAEARAALLEEMEPGVRARIHRRAARLLHDRGSSAPVIAEHILAGHPIEGAWMVPVLEAAARFALAEDQIPPAIACLDLARRLAPADQRADLLAQLTVAEWRVNPDRVGRLLPAIREALAGTPPIDAAIVLIKQLLGLGRIEDAQAALDRLSPRLRSSPGALRALRMWLRVTYPSLLTHLSSSRGARYGRHTLTPTMLEPVDALTVLCATMAEGPVDRMVSWAWQILENSTLTDSSYETIHTTLQALVYAERLTEAVPWCERFFNEALSRQAPSWIVGLSMVRAEIALRQGDLGEAEMRIRPVLERADSWGSGVAVGGLLSLTVNVASARGLPSDAAKLLQHPVPAATFESRFGLQYLHARGMYYLAANRPLAALDDLLQCGETTVSWGLDLPSFLPWRAGAAAAWLSLGEQQKARDLITEQLARPGAAMPRVQGMSLRLMAATLTDQEERREMLEHALKLLWQSGDRIEYALALLALSAAELRLDAPAAAEASARRAMDVARRCRAEPLVRRAASALGQERSVGETVAASARAGNVIDALSEAELKVAALAARGESNGSIARLLEITVSTVEQHLTRVYRKLEVPGRANLPPELRLAAS